MTKPTGESWPAFLWGGPVCWWAVRRSEWHRWRWARARAAVGRHEDAMHELQRWAAVELEKLR